MAVTNVALLGQLELMSIIALSFLASTTTTTEASSISSRGSQEPKVSIKVSTSIVESETPINLNQGSSSINWLPLSQANDSFRQQRSIPIGLANTLEPNRQLKFSNQDAINQPGEQHATRALLNINGRIADQQHNKRYQNHQDNQYYNHPAEDGRAAVLLPSSWSVGAVSPPKPSMQSYENLERAFVAPASNLMPQNMLVPQSSNYTPKQQHQQQQLQTKCHKRSIGQVLQYAKDMLTGRLTSLERSATSASNSFFTLSSSVLATAIPILVYLWPDSMNRASKFSLQGRVESMMGWVERSIEHLPYFPRLHPQECLKRSICEAHNEPDKYGAMGFMLRVLFPAYDLNSTDQMNGMDYKVINKYRYAAGFGQSQRLDTNGTTLVPACKDKYEDCLISLLEVSQNLMDMFLK